jgi:acylphosphatase
VTPSAEVRRHVIVSGRVQGVWFRESCRQEAAAAGVSGWVANRPDGRVEAEFEGDEAGVARLVEWCRRGPPRARVDSLEARELPLLGDPAGGFDVR